MLWLLIAAILSNAPLCWSLPITGSLQQVNDFGSNPAKVGFYIFVPTRLHVNPAIVVLPHACHGTAQEHFKSSPYMKLAEQHNFIAIYPNSPHSNDRCWDVSSRATLTHNGGGDSNSIANMVLWTLSNYKVDKRRVFVAGVSSGAMMTVTRDNRAWGQNINGRQNVLSATYPDIFVAAVVYAGVPAGCFASASGAVAAWNSSCAEGKVISSPQSWAGIVRNMYPGYNGPRPKMQIYHGGNDKTLFPQNYNETIKQWSGVFRYDYGTPVSTKQDVPSGGYVTMQWGPNLVGSYSNDQGHNVPMLGTKDMEWFGL